MLEIKTYPEMNETIKELLAMDKDDPVDAYALVRIEELEERRHCSAKEITINYLESVKKDKELQLERLEKTYPGARPIKRSVRLDIGYLASAIQLVLESEGE